MDKVDFIHMGGNLEKDINKDRNIRFYRDDKLMDIEDSHYWPTFIAKDVNELRNLPNVR